MPVSYAILLDFMVKIIYRKDFWSLVVLLIISNRKHGFVLGRSRK